MACLPQKPLSTAGRIISLILSYGGFGIILASYIYPTWSKFDHNGISGSLGIHMMCADETDGKKDCRAITGKDFLFYLFQGSVTIGMVAYGLFVLTVSMTFCSCIKSPRAVTMTKLWVVIFDLITFNCLMIAIATGLKTGFLGTVKISYGCIMCIIAFSIATILCPVYLLDARNTAKKLKDWKHKQFTDIQERCSIEETCSKSTPLSGNELNDELNYNSKSTPLSGNELNDELNYNSINPGT